ncbi:uncharacterized oxidoreductase TM_0325-like [Sitodiplosis mosellana]|uniref:uncharacterized oxidoreductase TM_0325-like n=1 Tax=Sitodiplosis mosellana TaxID=263140 RepID=UPI00244415EB|nr:uncharacterized oxidoreductase TM_0325-like [Sitodiplosis mosellana]
MIDFTKKVVLITGAATGIGANAARYIAKLGGQVALVDINATALNEVVEQIKGDHSPNALAIVADVTEDSERIIAETIDRFGRLDVLVNNAAIACEKNIMEADINDFDRMMNTNLRSIVILSKLAVPHLEKSKGNIVNVSSISGIVPVKYAYYGMTKAALDQFSKSAANEFGPRNIRVNSINPSIVLTPMFEKAFTAEEALRLKNKCKEMYPIGRMGKTEEISAAIAFLASDAASFITGVQFAVDGGAISAGAHYLN